MCHTHSLSMFQEDKDGRETKIVWRGERGDKLFMHTAKMKCVAANKGSLAEPGHNSTFALSKFYMGSCNATPGT